VKSLLLHEFLHVLLNHTGEYDVCDSFTNLALDAVINHVVHRSCGAEFSEFFRIFYRNLIPEGESMDWRILLVPVESSSSLSQNGYTDERICDLHCGLASGTVLADDILELAEQMREESENRALDSKPLNEIDRFMYEIGREMSGESDHSATEPVFLGNHDADLAGRGRLSPLVEEALDETFRQYDGHGIFRGPTDHGFATPGASGTQVEAQRTALQRWERTAWKAIRPLLTPDPRSERREFTDREAILPVLNGRDRRGFLRSLWSPLVPPIQWDLPEERPADTTVVYLDVSGSMNAEMESLVTLLNRLRRWIRLPFWAFSTEVAPATIRKGRLETESTGGTAMNCVLAHLAETQAAKALVITDGYIEQCNPALLEAASGTKLHALVSRHGNPRALERAGIPTTQLAEFPG